MARRKSRPEKERNIRLTFFGMATLLGILSWRSGRIDTWVLPLLAIAYYQLCAVPTLCGVETTRGHPCKNRAYGRLMACKDQPSHGIYKTDALLRLIGFRRNPRSVTAPAPYAKALNDAPTELHMSEPATVEPKQLSITILTVALTIIGTVATVIQTLLAAAS